MTEAFIEIHNHSGDPGQFLPRSSDSLVPLTFLTPPNEDTVMESLLGKATVEDGIARCEAEDGTVTHAAVVRLRGRGEHVLQPLRLATRELPTGKEVSILELPIPDRASPEIAFFLSTEADEPKGGTRMMGTGRLFDGVYRKFFPYAQMITKGEKGPEKREVTYDLHAPTNPQEVTIAESVGLYERPGIRRDATRGMFSIVKIHNDGSGHPVERHPINMMGGFSVQLSIFDVVPHEFPAMPDVRSIQGSFPIFAVNA
jgi:hypothetical protein